MRHSVNRLWRILIYAAGISRNAVRFISSNRGAEAFQAQSAFQAKPKLRKNDTAKSNL
jgi:hypothetical protein